MDREEATTRLAIIREQLARSETFHGYRSSVVGLSGALAIATAVAQPLLAPAPMEQLAAYLALWISVAAVSAALAGATIVLRLTHDRSRLAREKAWMAIELFAPCLVAGALITTVIFAAAPGASWLLPGLWSICFSLGVFASQRCLTRRVFWVGLYYLVAGAMCLWLGQGRAALSPWMMGIAFGGGQLLAALVLHFSLECRDG